MRDKNALLLESSVPPGSILGYLPRGISQYLAPLVKQEVLGSCATVLELGSTPTSALNIELEVSKVSISDVIHCQARECGL